MIVKTILHFERIFWGTRELNVSCLCLGSRQAQNMLDQVFPVFQKTHILDQYIQEQNKNSLKMFKY